LYEASCVSPVIPKPRAYGNGSNQGKGLGAIAPAMWVFRSDGEFLFDDQMIALKMFQARQD
jgi:hypothetical protein